MKACKIIPVKQAPPVSNIAALPKGTGARYLECITAHRPELPLIAMQWRRRPPKDFEVLIDYKSQSGESDLSLIILAWLGIAGAMALVYAMWSYAATALEVALKL